MPVMHRSPWFLVVLPAVALLLAAVPARSTAPDAAANDDFAAIDAWVEAAVRELRVPGLSLGIVRGDRIVHLRGFGRADASGRPVTPATPFFLGSVSKSITALAVLQLADEGRVDIEAPVRRYLPDFHLADPAATERVTVRDLLQQQSGIPRSAGLRHLGASWTLADVLAALADVRPVSAPGTRFEYSNANYYVLGALVEAVTGGRFADHVQARVFAPLRMRHSFTDETEARRAGLAAGHRSWFGFPLPGEVPFNPSLLSAGNLMSSAEDMCHLLSLFLGGGQLEGVAVVSPEAVARLTTPPPGSPYAMGWAARSIGGKPAIGHSGSLANYHAEVVLVPQSGYGVVLLANVTSIVHMSRFRRLATGVAARLVGVSPPPSLEDGLGFRATYYLLAAAALVSLGLAVRSWSRLPAWRRRLRADLVAGRPVARRFVVPQIMEIAGGVAILWLIHAYFDITVIGMLRLQTDLGLWLAVTLASSVLGAVVRIGFLVVDRAKCRVQG